MIQEIIVRKVTKVITAEFCICQFLRYIKVESTTDFSKI